MIRSRIDGGLERLIAQLERHVELGILAVERLQEFSEGRGLLAILQDGPEAAEGDRLSAAMRLARCFPTPIHWTRRPRVEPALAQAAEQHGHSLREEIDQRVTAALFEIAETEFEYRCIVVAPTGLGGPRSPRAILEWPGFSRDATRQRLTYCLNFGLTEDLLGGPEWRRGGLDLPLGEAPSTFWTPEEAAMLRDSLIKVKVDLTRRENEALSLICAGIDSPETIADALQIPRNNADQILYRLRRKLRAVL